jgi:hypothetical protein
MKAFLTKTLSGRSKLASPEVQSNQDGEIDAADFNESSLPQSFFCAITHELMKDPVIDRDGNSYEREAIEKWLAMHGTSPITRTPMNKFDLRPNRSLLDCIQDHLKRLGVENSKPIIEAPTLRTIHEDPIQLCVSSDIENTLISVVPPSGLVRTPCDICCVVDTSGSMASPASMNTGSDTENHGFSVLDIVKHALRTVIHVLNDEDRLAVVSYNTAARQICGLTRLTADGKRTATASIEALSAGGQTNIWDGLLMGMEILRSENS